MRERERKRENERLKEGNRKSKIEKCGDGIRENDNRKRDKVRGNTESYLKCFVRNNLRHLG